MFVASQLAEVSRRFPAHVEEIREFLQKEKLPVPSPEAIPELAERLKTDTRLRADVSSLMRAVMYREREQVGYEDLLGILVAAAAGTEHDLSSEAQEACTREMLRFLLQSRRATVPAEIPAETEEPKAAVEDERPAVVAVAAEPVAPEAVKAEPLSPKPAQAGPVLVESRPVEPVQAEPVLVAAAGAEPAAAAQAAVVQAAVAPRWAVESVKREPRLAGSRVSFTAEPETGGLSDGMLRPMRTSGLFASQTEPEESWWRVHAVWIVGVVGVLLGVGVGAGLMMRHGPPVAGLHAAAPAANVASSGRSVAGAAVPKDGADSKGAVSRRGSAAVRRPGHEADAAGVETGKTASPVESAKAAAGSSNDRAAAQPAAGSEAGGSARVSVPNSVPDLGVAGSPNTAAVHTPDGAAVPVTVVKQVVTASENDEVEEEPTPTKAATRSIVQPGSAGIMAANVIFSPPPDYPAEATAAHVQGQVTVRAVVDPEGHVIYAHVVSGPTLLRDAALEAVQKWRYKPLLYFGKPIAVATTAILDFRVVK